MEQMYTVSWYDPNGELIECSFSSREVANYFYNYVSSRDQITTFTITDNQEAFE